MTSPRVTTDVGAAARCLRAGGIVAIPTETVYGLAALARDESAVHRVFEVKGRPRNHPLIVHVCSLEDARTWAVLDERAEALAGAYWPGPLTLVLPRTDLTPDWVAGGHRTVAVRMPAHPMALAVIEEAGGALVAPSANRFGRVSPTAATHVVADLDGDVDMVLDGGPCPIGIESTIVEIHDDVQILRPGAISAAQVGQTIAVAVSEATGASRAPGMLASHYAPVAKVRLFTGAPQAHAAAVRAGAGKVVVIDEPDTDHFAKTLYQRLRDADAAGATEIAVVMAPEQGIGVAINDRLRKAAAD